MFSINKCVLNVARKIFYTMETRRTKNRNRNLFLPLNNQMAEYMKIHDQKIQDYQNYLNFLHFNIIQNARNERHKAFHVPPPTPAILPFPHFASPPPTSTPVSLAFSHLNSPPPSSHTPSPRASPILGQCNQSRQIFDCSSSVHEPVINKYSGEEANVWGPGLLGLFAKSPNQLEILSNSSNSPHIECDLRPNRSKMIQPIEISEATKFLDSYTASTKSSLPPGFERTCSVDIALRDEMFTGNRSM